MVAYVLAMLIFGTMGPLVKYISLPAEIIALSRGCLGALCLWLAWVGLRQRFQREVLRRKWWLLLLSGAALGFNWIYLFAAYKLTSVASATVCYYMAPLMVMCACALIYKEKVGAFKWGCAAVALLGLALTAGFFDGNSDAKLPGVIMGLLAAVHYAVLILLNKRLQGLGTLELSALQLSLAGLILLPYSLWQVDVSALELNLRSVLLTLCLGLVHTGLAYLLYFGALQRLSGVRIAIFSYIDPAVAVLLSLTFLHESLSTAALIGAGLILGAAAASELVNFRRRKAG